jgi:hypothetical protein
MVAHEELKADELDERFNAASAVLVIYDEIWLSDEQIAALHRAHKSGHLAILVKRGMRKVPSDLYGLLEVPAMDVNGFSYYQPDRGTGGIANIVRYLGKPRKKPKDRSRRGFAFVSYSSVDRETVHRRLIPALAACRIGFFDYRFTERLREKVLEEEIARHIAKCEVVIACASLTWRQPGTRFIEMERMLARNRGLPLVAARAADDAGPIDYPLTVEFVLDDDHQINTARLDEAVSRAIQLVPSS